MTATAAPTNPPYFARTSLNLHSIFPHFLHSCDRGDSKKSIILGKHARAYTHTHTNARTYAHAYIHTHERTSHTQTHERASHAHKHANTRTYAQAKQNWLASTRSEQTSKDSSLGAVAISSAHSTKTRHGSKFCNLHISFCTATHIFLSLFLDFFTLWGYIEVYTNRGHYWKCTLQFHSTFTAKATPIYTTLCQTYPDFTPTLTPITTDSCYHRGS